MVANMASALTIEDIDNSGVTDNLILGNESPESLAISVINWVLGLLALVAVVLILVGGFRWMTAGGNEEKVESAKKTLYAALIGLVIILAGWGVSVYVINNLLDFTNAG
jgi:amino acid transporter